ncbi:hypothetical protein U879_16155 [Defluviimonas sp. 20V17]|nr:hypothetical protein U879_16155 [Defluviimonas sp. 20V17]
MEAVMRLTMAGLGMAVLLAGCGGGPADMSDVQGTVAPAGAATVSPARCGAEKLQGLIGKNEMVLQSTDLPSPARIYQVGSPIVKDYNAHRLNVEFSKARIITRVYCG